MILQVGFKGFGDVWILGCTWMACTIPWQQQYICRTALECNCRQASMSTCFWTCSRYLSSAASAGVTGLGGCMQKVPPAHDAKCQHLPRSQRFKKQRPYTESSIICNGKGHVRRAPASKPLSQVEVTMKSQVQACSTPPRNRLFLAHLLPCCGVLT